MNHDRVKDWMTLDPITIPSVCTLVEAYRLMVDQKTYRLLVVDRGMLVGVITLEDLRRKMPITLGLYSANPVSQYDDRTRVSHVMSKKPQTIQANSSLIQAAQLLLDSQLSALPVMDGDQAVGVITDSDILRALIKQLEVAP
jgi:acetoin utilization protein AcuB